MTQQHSGALKVKNVFSISGRGVAASGDVVEGVVRVGMVTQPLTIEGKERRLKVKGVEFVDSVSESRAEVALVFAELETTEQLDSALPGDRIIVCSDT